MLIQNSGEKEHNFQSQFKFKIPTEKLQIKAWPGRLFSETTGRFMCVLSAG